MIKENFIVDNKKIGKQFIGQNGRLYAYLEDALGVRVPKLKFMGDDGREYPTFETLVEANERHFRNTHFYIVHDAELGIRKIPPGTGKIRICVGHYMERNPDGSTKYVPTYREEIF